MKPGQPNNNNNNKQRSRGRGGSNGGKPRGGPPSRNQTFDSNGPEIRVRGNAHQVLDKYLTLARDAASQGDRIAAENYYQHAEHYFRVIQAQIQHSTQNGGQQQRRPTSTPAGGLVIADDENDNDGEDQANEEEAASDNQEDEPDAPAQAVNA